MIINLPQRPYLSGSLEFTPAQWSAIAEDRKRWCIVEQKFRAARGNTRQIREWLNLMPFGEYRDDMRRRCNVIQEGRFRGRRNGTV
jgi:hypothetical protein